LVALFGMGEIVDFSHTVGVILYLKNISYILNMHIEGDCGDNWNSNFELTK
jgi:hypothetical protein